ncbi:unnamed protein product [Effrenium voratum]|nr:unnamed protein product [Effrenium voratum]
MAWRPTSASRARSAERLYERSRELRVEGTDAPFASRAARGVGRTPKRAAKAAPRRPVSAAGGQPRQARCSCGTTFTADSVFCRVCGRRRSEAGRDQRGRSPGRPAAPKAPQAPQAPEPESQESQAALHGQSGYLPDVLQEIMTDFGQQDLRASRSGTLAPGPRLPDEVLARLRRLRLQRGLRIADVQALGDLNRDNKLTVAELRHLLAEVGLTVDDELLVQVFNLMDHNGNGKISWSELWNAMTPSASEVLAELRVAIVRRHISVPELIRKHDANADDVLTPGEFHRLLDGLGFDLDDATVRDVVRQIDLDGSKQVTRRSLEQALAELSGTGPVAQKLPPQTGLRKATFPRDDPWRDLAAPPPGGPKESTPDLPSGGLPQGDGQGLRAGELQSSPSGRVAPLDLSQSATLPRRPEAVQLPTSSLQEMTHGQPALDEILHDFELSRSFSPTHWSARDSSDPAAVLSRLRTLRLRRGLSINDLRAYGDLNQDGRLSPSEMYKLLVAAGIKADEGLVHELFRLMDKDGNGRITWTELWHVLEPTPVEVLRALRAVKQRKHLSASTLVRSYDSNGDDMVTAKELHSMLNDLGFELDDATVREVVRLLDQDGKRLVSLQELAAALGDRGSSRSPSPSRRSPSPSRRRADPEATAAPRPTPSAPLPEFLTREQLRSMLMAAGISGEDSLVEQIFRDMELNGSGFVARQEICWKTWTASSPARRRNAPRQPTGRAPELPAGAPARAARAARARGHRARATSGRARATTFGHPAPGWADWREVAADCPWALRPGNCCTESTNEWRGRAMSPPHHSSKRSAGMCTSGVRGFWSGQWWLTAPSSCRWIRRCNSCSSRWHRVRIWRLHGTDSTGCSSRQTGSAQS